MSAVVVGLTGGIGSGKSAVASLFGRYGIEEVDTDRIAHQLTGRDGIAIPELVAAFGPAVLSADGALDRGRMRDLAFSNPLARQRLESILHPLIRREADAACRAGASPYVLLVVPLMAETWQTSDYRTRCNRILVIDCDEATQVRRVMARSGLTEPEVRRILAAQASREQRLAIADDVIVNQGAPSDLASRVAELHGEYMRL